MIFSMVLQLYCVIRSAIALKQVAEEHCIKLNEINVSHAMLPV